MITIPCQLVETRTETDFGEVVHWYADFLFGTAAAHCCDTEEAIRAACERELARCAAQSILNPDNVKLR